MIAVEPLAPAIGAVVTGVDLAADMSEPIVRELVELLLARGVVVIRNQRIDHATYLNFSRFFGTPLRFFLAEHRDRAFPEIIRIDNDPATPPAMRDGAVHWHSDSSYEEVPAAVTMLYGVEAPDTGGVTRFASTAAAYAALPAEERARIDGLVAVHQLGMAPWIEGETVPDPDRPSRDLPTQRHPLVMRHPVTGAGAIFASGTACGIEGMEPGPARTLIRSLREHVVSPEFRTEYKVTPGDLVLWDNFSTVHTASPIEYSDVPGRRRLLYRISTKGWPAQAGFASGSRVG